MRILYVCDYDAWNKIAKGDMPKHHLFGFAKWIKKWIYNSGGVVVSAILDDSFLNCNCTVDFIKIKSTKDLFTLLKIVFCAHRYDFIYDTLNNLKIIEVLKKYNLFRTPIISIMHHPIHYEQQLRLSKSDAYIFFCNAHKEYVASLLGEDNRVKHLYVNEWWPDVKWYQTVIEKNNLIVKELDFIDNGRTGRDRALLLKVAKRFPNNSFMLAGDIDATDGNIITYKPNPEDSEIKMVARMIGAKCIVIPLNQFPMLPSPTGITSFLDAIAYKVPVICTNDSLFADVVIENGIGLVYSPNSEESLYEAIRCISENQEEYEKLKENMVCFSNEDSHNEEGYSIQLQAILKSEGFWRCDV